MAKWEYRLERLGTHGPKDLAKQLTALDEDGWEPVSISWGATSDVLLRRPRRATGLAARFPELDDPAPDFSDLLRPRR